MFRLMSSRFMMARSLPLLSSVPHNLPEGFEFFENKVVDKDIHSNYENLETLRLTLNRQDEFLMKEHPVKCVTVTGVNGESGIFPGHAYEIIQLAPAPLTVELTDGTIQKYFTSGGFAHVNNEGSCDICCVECLPLSELDLESAEKALQEQNSLLGQAKDEKAKSVVEIRINVLESIINTLKHN